MKIECEICQTVFLIDDSLISEKGIKAQCPRCGHQTVVRREASQEEQFQAPPEAPHADASLFTGAAPSFDSGAVPLLENFGSPTGSLSSFEENPYDANSELGFSDDFGSELTCFKCGKPISQNSDSVLPVCEDCQTVTSGYEEAPHIQEDLPTMASIPNDELPPLMEPDAHDPSMGEHTFLPFDKPSASAPEYIPMDALPPNDPEPFPHEMLLDENAASFESPEGEEGEGRLDPTWIKVRRISDGKEVGPISLAEVRSLYVHGKLSFDDEYAGRDGVWFPIHQVPELLVILRRTPQLGAGTAEQGLRGNRGQGIVLWLLALLLLGGGGGTAWLIWYNSSKNKKNSNRTAKRHIVRKSKLLAEKMVQWKQQFPDIKPNSKQSKQWNKEGWGSLALDQPEAYSHSIKLFSQALVADQKNTKALAGYCLATVWSPSREEASARKQGECSSILKRQFKVKKIPILRSVYAIYLARRGSGSKARRYAKKATKQGRREAWTYLIQAEILLSQQRSLKKIPLLLKKALKINQQLARALLRLANLELKQRHYYSAGQNLEILAKKQHPRGLYLSAQFNHALGYHRKASKVLKKLLKKNPTHLKGWLMLAILRYQFLRQRKTAYKQLLKPPTLGPGRELPKVLKKKRLLHLAYIEILMGKLKNANKHLAKLKKLGKTALPTQFLEVQLLAARKLYKKASDRFVTLQSRLSSPKYQAYAALLLMKEGKTKTAVKRLRQQMDDNSHFIWPRLLLPAAYFSLKKKDFALVLLKKALDIEPTILKQQAKISDFYFVPAPWLSIKALYRKLRVTREERALTTSAAGLVAYHLNRQSEALRLFRRSRGIDRNGLTSNLYLAQIYYDQKKYGSAKRYARRVYQKYDQHTVSTLILAWLMYRKKKYRSATKLFQTVRKERPWFLSAKIGEALVLNATKKRTEGLKILKTMLTSQETHHLLARALYELKW